MTRSVFYVFPGRFNLIVTGIVIGIILIGSRVVAQNTVGIGTSEPNPNAVLDLNSPTNSQGFLAPRLRTAERNGIPASSPADDGLLVYDLEQKNFFYWHDGAWHAFIAEAGATDYQQLTLIGNILTLENGGSVDLTSYLDNTDGQQLDFDDGTGVLSISGGNLVDLSSLASGGFSGSFLDLTDVPAQLDVDGTDDVNNGDNISVLTNDAGYITSADDADSDPTNEAISSVTLAGTILNIFENGSLAGSANLSLLPFSTFSGDFSDLTNVPPNLDMDNTDDLIAGDNISLLNNDMGYITSADDADADPTNEAISNVTLNVNSLEVYENGLLAGSADLSGLLDNTDDQSITQFNLTGTFNEELNITLENDPGGSKQVNLHSMGFAAGSDLTGTLGNASLKDGSVDSNAIQDGTIVSGDIQDNTITANDIANNAIGTSEIADGAVTDAKISGVAPGKITQGGASNGQVLKWNGVAWAPADDDISVVSVSTSFHSIDPSDFMAMHVDDQERDKNQVIIFQSDNTFVTVQQADKASRLIAPVHLPHGATITELSLFYMDNAPENIDFSLLRKSYTGSNQIMTSWSSSVASPVINTQVLSSFTGAVIDNENYSYRIVIDFDPDTPQIQAPSDADVRVYGIRIAYTEP